MDGLIFVGCLFSSFSWKDQSNSDFLYDVWRKYCCHEFWTPQKLVLTKIKSNIIHRFWDCNFIRYHQSIHYCTHKMRMSWKRNDLFLTGDWSNLIILKVNKTCIDLILGRHYKLFVMRIVIASVTLHSVFYMQWNPWWIELLRGSW